VPFYDVDAMAVCWHGNYVKYFEEARGVLLRKIDYDYPQMLESGYYWPVIDLNIRYVKALRYAQQIEVIAELVEYEACLKFKYRIHDCQTGDKLTKGSTTQVAVTKDTLEMQLASPPILREKLAPFL